MIVGLGKFQSAHRNVDRTDPYCTNPALRRCDVDLLIMASRCLEAKAIVSTYPLRIDVTTGRLALVDYVSTRNLLRRQVLSLTFDPDQRSQIRPGRDDDGVALLRCYAADDTFDEA